MTNQPDTAARRQRERFPLTDAALQYWDDARFYDVIEQGRAENAWINGDYIDEARSAPVDEGGLGMVSAFGPDGIDPA